MIYGNLIKSNSYNNNKSINDLFFEEQCRLSIGFESYANELALTESFGGDTIIVRESFGEAIKNIFAKIKELINKFIQALKNIAHKIAEKFGKAKTDAAAKAAKDAPVKNTEETFEGYVDYSKVAEDLKSLSVESNLDNTRSYKLYLSVCATVLQMENSEDPDKPSRNFLSNKQEFISKTIEDAKNAVEFDKNNLGTYVLANPSKIISGEPTLDNTLSSVNSYNIPDSYKSNVSAKDFSANKNKYIHDTSSNKFFMDYGKDAEVFYQNDIKELEKLSKQIDDAKKDIESDLSDPNLDEQGAMFGKLYGPTIVRIASNLYSVIGGALSAVNAIHKKQVQMLSAEAAQQTAIIRKFCGGKDLIEDKNNKGE